MENFNGNDNVGHRLHSVNGDSVEVEDPLVNLMDRTGYSMVQENGQRKLGGPPPGWTGPPPPKGSEIFVGKIPRDLFENELFPVFEKIGKIYEMRLMMDFSGTNRGYAFVCYTNIDDAKRAIAQLNNFEIRRGKYLGVVKSVDNCRLFVGHVPKNKTKEEIWEEISKVTEGVVDVILYNSPRDKSKNRGFAFVEYESHRAAAIARRKLLPGRILLWNQQIQVDWAEPEPEVDEEIMATVKVLYVRNLMESTSEEIIRNVFESIRPKSVERVKKMRDFAFVHFATREDAEEAKHRLNNTEIDGADVVVTWSKPNDRSNRGVNGRRNGQYGTHSYQSPTVRFPVTYPSGMDSSHVPFGMPQSGHFIAYPPSDVVGRSNGVYGIKPVSPRGRGRGAAGIRNARGYFNGMRHPEYRFFGTQQGIPFLPPNAMPIMRPVKSPVQALAEICQKKGYGEPHYQVLPCVTPHGDGPNGPQYQCKVTIPNWGEFTSPAYVTADEAKHVAACGVLFRLTDGWEDLDSSKFNSLSPSYSTSQKAVSFHPSNNAKDRFDNKFKDCHHTARNEIQTYFELQQSPMYAFAGGPTPHNY
ncbi:APOB1 complementation factor [Chamberlinius hualienensis]